MHHYDLAGSLLRFTALHTTLTFGSPDIYDLIRKYLSSWKPIWSPCFRWGCLEAIITSFFGHFKSLWDNAWLGCERRVQAFHESWHEFTFFQRVIVNIYMTIQRFFTVYFYSLAHWFYFWEFSCRNNQTIQRFQERGVIILSLLRQEVKAT